MNIVSESMNLLPELFLRAIMHRLSAPLPLSREAARGD
jgi:hypothetical protein